MSDKKHLKVSHLGTYQEFCEKMVESGSKCKMENILEENSDITLSAFNKYEGQIEENEEGVTPLDYGTFPNEDTETMTTQFSIVTKNYTEEEINKAMYQAFKYLDKWYRKGSDKDFIILKDSIMLD